MDITHSINCPDCDGKIFLELNSLLTGGQFTCNKCGLAISLSGESNEVMSNAVSEFKTALKKKEELSQS
ncbi:hypothetical protein Rhal01_02228 [Rubritalea halochordaticola]|uniref:TFIIB-type domain-containing protein n=1 Tax=Rubritalea halochordaticola TaxID=714537 RepID=A0ABP9V066_9BACT